MVNRRRSPVEPAEIEEHHCSPAEQRRLLGGTPFFRKLPPEEIDAATASFWQADFPAAYSRGRS